MEMKKEPDPVSKSNFQRVTKEVMMRRTFTVLFMKKATILSFPLFKIPLKRSAHFLVTLTKWQKIFYRTSIVITVFLYE